MKLTTSDKGDIAVAMVIADLTSKGIKISLPISAHLPFDLIAISEDYNLSRIQIKYCDGDEKIVLKGPKNSKAACETDVFTMEFKALVPVPDLMALSTTVSK